ncbi:MAG: hypothetical protein J7J22_04195 [Candidatus Verstraetearchaeota archaeon]|nr:hypothetical protein [Candidatus Verstraetearchaeota archaeon]
MPRCPYARTPDVEHSGLFVKCAILNQNVSPVIFPCFRDFENCKYYKSVAEKIVKVERGKVKVAGETSRNCTSCVFYSEASGRCLKLGVKVDDPARPPCMKSGDNNHEYNGGDDGDKKRIKISKIFNMFGKKK